MGLFDSDGTAFGFKAPKTASGRRVVPLDRQAQEALRQLRTSLGAEPHPERLVFASEAGCPMRQSNVLRRILHPILKEAKVPTRGWHAFRHALVTDALDAGANPAQVSALVGHTRASFTIDRYASPVEGAEHDVLKAVERRRAERADGA